MNTTALILAALDIVGPTEAAKRVAPAWGCSPDSAATRISRYRAHLRGERGPNARDITSASLWPLLSVLGIDVAPKLST